MGQCDVCGNDYDKAFRVTQGDRTMTFDSFVRHPRHGPPMRPLRMPRGWPRHRGQGQDLLLRPLRSAGRRPGRQGPRCLRLLMIRKLKTGQYRLYSRKINPKTTKAQLLVI